MKVPKINRRFFPFFDLIDVFNQYNFLYSIKGKQLLRSLTLGLYLPPPYRTPAEYYIIILVIITWSLFGVEAMVVSASSSQLRSITGRRCPLLISYSRICPCFETVDRVSDEEGSGKQISETHTGTRSWKFNQNFAML